MVINSGSVESIHFFYKTGIILTFCKYISLFFLAQYNFSIVKILKTLLSKSVVSLIFVIKTTNLNSTSLLYLYHLIDYPNNFYEVFCLVRGEKWAGQ